MDELVADAFVDCHAQPVEIMSIDDWLDSESPTGDWESAVFVHSIEYIKDGRMYRSILDDTFRIVETTVV